ncbi:MAG: hypothetical protein Q7J25_03985 [Vicinamibacterales bacterium]|nr:hypothetical protein [Vicinamibacterales bacterium]
MFEHHIRETVAADEELTSAGLLRSVQRPLVPVDSVRSDEFMTPSTLAKRIVAVLQPSGVILEPCPGTGNFVRALRPYGTVLVCRGDFYAWQRPCDWIITNPPYSQFKDFLAHALTLATHVALLAPINHSWTKLRVRLVRDAGFGYRQLWLVETSSEFPSSGFQFGVMVLTRGHRGSLMIRHLDSSSGATFQTRPRRR